ncbi:hypothetical protein CRU98_05645 [Arcobacter sp. CECT 8986]|uniref:hypothetical protein n=1 Tax=Arcobacter sp. CECT 8986 TaxID=2044507 RepID=UPI001009D07F|nr:hypothetical protein [Arcobacter sp. CECT 8986]RXJ99510.1 hypothetical protein CRU98_05645 [Arcobacter sp. CECT 8986]
MSETKYDIIDAAEDAAKVGYSVGVFACKFFYQVSNVEALKNGMDAYMLSRFSQRLEYFTHEHSKLKDEQKKSFYDDLSSNTQNLNYLYDFIEKSRTTVNDLHAKLLARLSVELVKNKKLDYYEMTLLSNIHMLNDLDLIKIHKELSKVNFSSEGSKIFEVNTFEDYCTFNKCNQLGFFEYRVKNSNSVMIGGNPIVKHERSISNKKFKINDFTKRLFEMLDEIINS